MPSAFLDSVLALVVRTSTDLPPDVRAAMRVAMGQEREGTQSSQALAVIAQNIDLAADEEGAICQDTGMPTFEVKTPVGANRSPVKIPATTSVRAHPSFTSSSGRTMTRSR
jgi:fumarate hydratase class I